MLFGFSYDEESGTVIVSDAFFPFFGPNAVNLVGEFVGDVIGDDKVFLAFGKVDFVAFKTID